jgi:hypothetical protein
MDKKKIMHLKLCKYLTAQWLINIFQFTENI